jgi:hypothetical protein
METISIKFDIPGMEIFIDTRWELAKTIDNALQDSGRWPGCRYTKDIITIHAVVDDQEQARSLIRSAIEGYPVFSNNIKKVLISRSA